MERVGCRQHGHIWLVFSFFLLNAGFMANAQTKAQEYIDLKQQQVQDLATSAVDNANNCAYLIKTCKKSESPGDTCSRAACFQTISDVAHSNCVGVTANTNCTCNNQIRADYTRSYVRVPRLGNGLTLNDEIVAAICTQRQLDDTLLSRNNQYVYEYDHIYYTFHLGTVDGTLRFFPGTAIADCNAFDPRVRPWYIGAISVVKDLVVLVDAASSMSNLKEFNGYYTVTASAMAINMTVQLLDTLTQSDRATVMAYYSDGLLLFNGSYTVPPADGTTLNLTLDNRFLDLRSKVSNLNTTGTTDFSNTTAAILQALQVLNNVGSPAGALKVIVVLTDGRSPVPLGLDDLVHQLNTSSITLFVYQIDNNDGGLAGLASNLTRGRNEQVNINPTTVLNPLYTLKSYFSFLANARNASGNDSCFWQPPYEDYNFLGQVRTVAYPAISSSGDLVGVAGITIQFSKIDPTIAPEIERILSTTKVTYPPRVSPTKIPTLLAISNVGGSTSCNASIVGTTSTDAICQPNANDMEVKYMDGLCCSQSGCSEQHKNLTALWICLGIVGVLAMAGIVFMAWKKKRTNKVLQSSGVGNSNVDDSKSHKSETDITSAEVIREFGPDVRTEATLKHL